MNICVKTDTHNAIRIQPINPSCTEWLLLGGDSEPTVKLNVYKNQKDIHYIQFFSAIDLHKCHLFLC